KRVSGRTFVAVGFRTGTRRASSFAHAQMARRFNPSCATLGLGDLSLGCTTPRLGFFAAVAPHFCSWHLVRFSPGAGVCFEIKRPPGMTRAANVKMGNGEDYVALTSATNPHPPHGSCAQFGAGVPNSGVLGFSRFLHQGVAMEYDDYLRIQAEQYRQLAEKAQDIEAKLELLDLAAACEEVANHFE